MMLNINGHTIRRRWDAAMHSELSINAPTEAFSVDCHSLKTQNVSKNESQSVFATQSAIDCCWKTT